MGDRASDRAKRGAGYGGGPARAALVVALLVLAAPRLGGAAGEPADEAAEEVTVEDCIDCHEDAELTSADGRSMFVSGAEYAASAHGEFPCTDCHADAGELPHEDDLAAVGIETCQECHEAEGEEYRQSRHAAHDGEPAAASCTDCHGGIHAARSNEDPDSQAHWSHLAAACARCHAASAEPKAHIPIVQPVEAYLDSVHGRRVAEGERAAVCSDCHGAHAILPATDPRSTIWPSHVPDTCGSCHEEITAKFRDSVHGTALARGVRDAPSCTDCHGEHRILSSSDPTAPVFAGNLPAETCGRCHGNLRLASRYGLSIDQVSSFRDSFHGLALRAGQVNVANCASCHGVHDILPSSDPRSLTNAANLPDTCGKCHPGAGSSFAIGAVHVLPTRSSGRAEYWIRYVYRWAIGLVVGFMLLHVAVDLARKGRHTPPPASPAASPRPERMSRAMRWQHGLVMLSFPILVVTGFALTYPESWWAAPLLGWETRFGLRGSLHRGAALLIVAALLWHGAHLARSAELRRRLRGLRWSWSDLRYFAARLAWYAGLRRSLPPSGPFSYIEKVEYWAFIWGMAVMTATGALLWWSDVVLRHLPKWVSDVATAIHFYEAVLATLAVAVWHMYWVIFDPDVYPMDPTWWSGRPPDSRTREREGEGGDDQP